MLDCLPCFIFRFLRRPQVARQRKAPSGPFFAGLQGALSLRTTQPLANITKRHHGPIPGVVGAFSHSLFIAQPWRGCLRGRSGRARGPQATGGPGGGTPRRARSALGAGRVGQWGTIRPPLGGTIEGRGSRPKGGGTPQGCPVPIGTPAPPGSEVFPKSCPPITG